MTIGIWDSFKGLSDLGINIPEKPIIELLVDDRNTIQHRFGFPNEEAVYFYLTGTKDFFHRFLKDEYNSSLREELEVYLTQDHLELLGISKSELEHIQKLKDVSVEMAILQISGDIEKLGFDIIKPYRETKNTRDINIRRKLSMPMMYSMNVLLRILNDTNEITEEEHQELKQKYHQFRDYRNQISHGRLKKSVGKRKLESVYEYGIDLLKMIKNGVDKNIFTHERLDNAFGFDNEENDKE